MTRLDFRGGAAKCAASSSIAIDDTTISLTGDTSGWPTGASSRNFMVIIDRGVPGKMEKILCSALSGDALTVAQRGYDGTTPVTHDAGATVEHGFGASILDDLSGHVYDTTRDDHEQYVRVDGTRAFSDVDGIVDGPVAVGTANAEGSADTLARSDHVHDIADNAVGTAQLADSAVTSAKIAPTYQAYTPVVSQSTLPTMTVTHARYVQEGKHVHGYARLAVASGAGTGGFAVAIELPAAPKFNDVPLGWADLFDASSSVVFGGPLYMTGTDSAKIRHQTETTATNYLGVQGFTDGLAVGDVLAITFDYEAA